MLESSISGPEYLTAIGSTLYFTAHDGIHGRELWKTDGTEAGTVLVKDIRPGFGGSNPRNLTAVGATLYFVADDGTSGHELWKTDGTEPGTVRVMDIRAGHYSSLPSFLTAFGSSLYFMADDGESGRSLWKTDGTEAGTVLFKDIPPRNFTVVESTLYFTAYERESDYELWKTDGTEEGTVLVKDLRGSSNLQWTSTLSAIGSTLYFTAYAGGSHPRLWKTKSGTLGVKQVVVGDRGLGCGSLTGVGSTLYFSAYETSFAHGRELWKTDGTDAGTVLVKDIWPGTNSSNPQNLTAVGSTLYFMANDGTSGYSLWKTNGTQAGTVLVKDIRVGGLWPNPPVADLTVVGSTLYFRANDGIHGYELWKTDGRQAGTVLVEDIRAGQVGSNPRNITAVGSTLYFTADDGIHGERLWVLPNADASPPTVPLTPTDLSATAGYTEVSLTWTTPSFNGGAVISDYVIQYSSNNGSTWTTFNRAGSSATSAMVTGLTNGTAYVFRVAAVNSAGPGVYSANSDTVIPFVADGLPSVRELRVMPGTISGEVFAAWELPAGAGIFGITDFVVQASPDHGQTWQTVDDGISTQPYASLTGMDPSQSFVIRVAAANAAGAGPWSAYSAEVSPSGANSDSVVEFVHVGDPGNDSDPANSVPWGSSGGGTGQFPTVFFGAVGYEYRLMKFTFTNAQYVTFLNAIDPYGSNPNSVWSDYMGTSPRSGISLKLENPIGSRYAVKANMVNKPVVYISWFDAARVANWLHNGAQEYGSTNSSADAPQNTGAYTLGTVTSGTAPAKNAGALFYIPTEDEWYKAAYYDPTLNADLGGYRMFGNGFDTVPGIVSANEFGDGSAGNSGNFANYNSGAVWNSVFGNVTTVGTNGGASYYGAFDMSGNVNEWNDRKGLADSYRGVRGGSWQNTVISSSARGSLWAGSDRSQALGFRLASRFAPLSFISYSLFSSPTVLTATRDVTTATLTWQLPQAEVSLENLGYVVQLSGDGGKTWTTTSDSLPSSASSYQFTGLAADQQYLFRVATKSTAGVGAFSEAVAPATTPRAPTALSATVGNAQASLTWTAPSSNGGAVITDYVVQYSSNNGGTWTTFNHLASAGTSATITGVTNGTAYIFRVAAVNSAGTGEYSANSDPVTPTADTPTNRQPIAIVLDDLIQTLPESTSISGRTRVATLTLTDDGVGTNTFTLLGADAGFFEIIGDGLYLKAGVSLDYGTKPRYDVAVRVGDSTAIDWLADTPLTGFYNAATGDFCLENTTDDVLSLQSVTIVSPSQSLSGVQATVPAAAFSTLNSEFGIYGVHSEIFFANFGSSVLTLAAGARWDLGAVAVPGMSSADIMANYATEMDADPSGESAAGRFLYSVVAQPVVRGSLVHRVETSFVLEITSIPEHSGREFVEVSVGQELIDTTPRSGDRQLVMRGGGRTVLNAANTHSGGTRIEAGEVVVRHASGLGSGTLEVLPGARVTLDVDFSRVNVSNLVVHEGAVINVGRGGLVLPAGSMTAAEVRAFLVAGRNGGSWNGAGIGTSDAPAGSRRAVGFRVMPNNSIVVAWAAFGDTNLDGRINSTDINMILSAGRFGTPASDGGWWQGDFNYDGRVNSSDINLLMSSGLLNAPSYHVTVAGTSMQATASATAMLATAFGTLGPKAEPEPVPTPVPEVTPQPIDTIASPEEPAGETFPVFTANAMTVQATTFEVVAEPLSPQPTAEEESADLGQVVASAAARTNQDETLTEPTVEPPTAFVGFESSGSGEAFALSVDDSPRVENEEEFEPAASDAWLLVAIPSGNAGAVVAKIEAESSGTAPDAHDDPILEVETGEVDTPQHEESRAKVIASFAAGAFDASLPGSVVAATLVTPELPVVETGGVARLESETADVYEPQHSKLATNVLVSVETHVPVLLAVSSASLEGKASVFPAAVTTPRPRVQATPRQVPLPVPYAVQPVARAAMARLGNVGDARLLAWAALGLGSKGVGELPGVGELGVAGARRRSVSAAFRQILR